MKKIILLVAAILIGIQFIKVEMTNPPVTNSVAWSNMQTEEFARRACYDCHSNETKWPWYSKIAPVSWLLASDVNEGREKLNFSTGNLDDAREAASEVTQEKMPLKIYLLLHPEAKLTLEEKQAFISGLKSTFGSETVIDKLKD